MIKSVIKTPNNMVIVFDERGEQILEYQGRYEEVKESILKDAPPDTLFSYFLNYETGFEIVPREEW